MFLFCISLLPFTAASSIEQPMNTDFQWLSQIFLGFLDNELKLMSYLEYAGNMNNNYFSEHANFTVQNFLVERLNYISSNHVFLWTF